jgi:hypothetical protein
MTSIETGIFSESQYQILRYFTGYETPPPFFAHAEMLPVHTAVIF